jgi:hypothetical protein
MNTKPILFLISVTGILAQEAVQVKPKGEFAKISTELDTKIIPKLTSQDAKIRDVAISDVLSKPNKYAPPTLYLLSRVLFAAGRKSEAVRWFYTGQLRARYDANRCADQTARQAVAVLNREFGPEINKYAFTDKKLLKEAVFAALAFVTDNSEDYDHRWINLHGMAAFTTEAGTVQSTPLSLPKAEWAKIKAKTIADYKEGFEDAYKQIP